MTLVGQPTGRPVVSQRERNYTQGGPTMGYATSRQLNNFQTKYQCIVTGEKRHQPCSGCTNQKGCLLKTLHHKEP